MFARSPRHALNRKITTLALIAFCAAIAAESEAATVDIKPGANIPSVVAANPAGTTFLIYPGTYRLQAHIIPKNGDSFIGQTACAPPSTACPAILSGSRIIGSSAKFNGTNYEVTGQAQQGTVSMANTVCQPGHLACNRPEDLFFDGSPYQHLYATSLPTIGAGQWWFDYASHTIYFHDNPAGHTVETSVLDTAFDSSANNVTIQYLTVEDFANPLQRAGIEATSGNVSSSSSLNWVLRTANCSTITGQGFGWHLEPKFETATSTTTAVLELWGAWVQRALPELLFKAIPSLITIMRAYWLIGAPGESSLGTPRTLWFAGISSRTMRARESISIPHAGIRWLTATP